MERNIPEQASLPDGIAAAEAPRLAIVPAEGSVLARLLSEHHAAKQVLEDARVREKDLRIQIETALAMAHEGTSRFAIAGGPGWEARNLTWIPGTMRLDSRRLRAERPDVWDAYAKPGEGYWDFRPAGNG